MSDLPRVAASILFADFTRLGEEVMTAVRAGADWVHVDVMDHHYVPNLTVGPLVCEALRPLTGAPIDVHLMVKPVDVLVPAFAKAGADLVTFHPEATDDVQRTAMLVKEYGCKVGLALNAATPLDVLDGLLGDLDMVVVTSVNPGSGGQCFSPSCFAKIRAVRERIAETGRAINLEVDGGVRTENAAEIVRAGADVLVAGSALFGSGDYAAAVAAIKGSAAPRARGLAIGGIA